MEEKCGELAQLCMRILGSWRSFGRKIWGAGGGVQEKIGELAELWRRNAGVGGAVEDHFGELAELWKNVLGS